MQDCTGPWTPSVDHFRELRRNHFRDTDLPDVVGYFAVTDHNDCAKRRSRKRKSRKPRRARKRPPPKFHRDVSILFRPDVVAHRQEFGHWEGDLMLFKQHFGARNVTSLVERVSRFTVLLKNDNKRTSLVLGKLARAIRHLPLQSRKSITFDRGTEFVGWPHLQADIGTQTWFCDPSVPWQKGTVENTNRRARRWLPCNLDMGRVSDLELKDICDRLNATPRKCLGWKTPAEVFRENMLAG